MTWEVEPFDLIVVNNISGKNISHFIPPIFLKMAILQKDLDNINEFINSELKVCETWPIASFSVNQSLIRNSREVF